MTRRHLMIGCILLCFVSNSALARVQVETICDDGMDNDGDHVMDCGDSDCSNTPTCAPDGQPENTDARCSDWIDNDDNGAMDCDDIACLGAGVLVCQGSWQRNRGASAASAPPQPAPAPPAPAPAPDSEFEQIELNPGETYTDLMGTRGDKDGERNDLVCSDGIDNDRDGRTDCADFGCRFNPEVSVCQDRSGMRFSIVANVEQSYDLENEVHDTRFSKLQLRTFGTIPAIQDSFYLVSMRAEKVPRLTFAMFQIPIGGGHTVNLNSGGGGLSVAPVLSAAKHLMLEQAYYVTNAFQQGNGAAVEFQGPLPIYGSGIADGAIRYMAYAGGGAGRSSGNVGGRYYTYDNTNYTWSAGGRVDVNIIGFVNPRDTQFLLVPASTALAIRFGAKYDRRAQERFEATNAQMVFRFHRFQLSGEHYFKNELNFKSKQNAYNVQLGYLVWNETLMIAADFGQFLATEYKHPPATEETDIKKIRDETQWRAAIHYYFWRNIGVLTLLYKDRWLEAQYSGQPDEIERIVKLVGQYRF